MPPASIGNFGRFRCNFMKHHATGFYTRSIFGHFRSNLFILDTLFIHNFHLRKLEIWISTKRINYNPLILCCSHLKFKQFGSLNLSLNIRYTFHSYFEPFQTQNYIIFIIFGQNPVYQGMEQKNLNFYYILIVFQLNK